MQSHGIGMHHLAMTILVPYSLGLPVFLHFLSEKLVIQIEMGYTGKIHPFLLEKSITILKRD